MGKYDVGKLQLEKKIPDISNFVKKSDYNAKVSEIEGNIPSISVLATTSALTAVRNKIPSVSTLVKKRKTDYDTKIRELEKKRTDHKHDKYITNPKFNKLTAENFVARLAKTNLITKQFLMQNCLNKKITSNETKHLVIENELKKLETFGLGFS